MSNKLEGHAAGVSSELSGSLWSASFLALLLTQLLTAVNDNIFRWLVIGIGKDYVAPSQVGLVLAVGTACFVAPYLVLAAPAGYLADRFSKSGVIVGCKVLEIVVMLLGVVAIISRMPVLLFIAVALMGAQSALFSPSRLGSIPELLKVEKIPAANGLFGLSSVAAAVIGMALGGKLKDLTGQYGAERWYLSALVLVGIAALGTLSSLMIRRLRPANPGRRFPWDAPQQTLRDLRTLASSRPLLRVALGIVFFWSVGALAQMNIDQFSADSGGLLESDRTPFLICLVLGVGCGSVLAGIWSAGRIELGMLPLGAAGMIVASVLLFGVRQAIILPGVAVTAGMVWACTLLFFLGCSAGLFDVPLESYMQHRSPLESRGAILAATNFLTFGGILVASLFYWVMKVLGFSAREIFLVVGICTVPVLVYIVWLIPQASIRFLVWLASKTVYRIRVYGREHLPERGGALLVANHVSFLDGVLLLLTSSRPVRIIAWAGNFQSRLLQRLAAFWGAILISGGPKSIRRALETARQALLDGELVAIFPEGGMTRSGQIQGFKPGMMKILEGTDAPVVPVYLDELWGSIFSYEGGKVLWKVPRRWPYPISIHFGQSLARAEDVHQVRRAVQDLGAAAMQQRSHEITSLPAAFVRRCRQRRWRPKVADSTGVQLSGGALLARCLVLRRLLRRLVLQPDEQHVGVLLPPTVGAVAANMALALDRRIAVNLNYTVSSEVLNQCIAQCQIRHVLTSRSFMDRMSFELDAELVYLEDFRDQPERRPRAADKLLAAVQAYLVPSGLLQRQLGLTRIQSDEVLTVIFTSGSTGVPKGVMLTHANVRHNVEAIEQVVQLTRRDVLVGVLPFFHSFGYTVTLWGAMALDIKACYHFNPLEGRQVGKLCQNHQGTLLLATPTFLRHYLRRCTPEQLASLEVVVAGAEKLPPELAEAFEQKFGVRPVEGYGTTELSPLVSVNVPPSRSIDNFQVDCKEGTVGRPVPGVSAKVTDLETGRELGANQEGMLWIKGPNVMKGYLGRPDLTAEVIQDGWYKTGDVALIDEDGFIRITGRQSRFSKIGGEMVPHVQVEEALSRLLAADEEDTPKVAVTAVPDAKKGERLVVLHTAIDKSPQQLCTELAEAGLPPIYIPSADSFCLVDELPLLGSGKLDLKRIQQMALERFGSGQ